MIDLDELLDSDEVLASALGFPTSKEFRFGFRVSIFNPQMREARLRLGLTQKQLGERVGLSGAIIGQIETFRHFPTGERAERLASVLGLDIEKLFPEWLRFYVLDRSTRVFTSTNSEIREALGNKSAAGLEKLIQPLIDQDPDPTTLAETAESKAAIDEVLNTLTARERAVVELRFGLGESDRPHTLEEIGKIYGVSKDRIRQILEKALRRLRHPTRSKRLKDFLPRKAREDFRYLPNPADSETASALKSTGFVFLWGNNALLPDGWRSESPYLFDEKGRPRFVVAGNKLVALRRFSVSLYEPLQEKGTVVGLIKDGNKTIKTTESFDLTHPSAERLAQEEAEEYLDLRYPNWRKPTAYWD